MWALCMAGGRMSLGKSNRMGYSETCTSLFWKICELAGPTLTIVGSVPSIVSRGIG